MKFTRLTNHNPPNTNRIRSTAIGMKGMTRRSDGSANITAETANACNSSRGPMCCGRMSASTPTPAIKITAASTSESWNHAVTPVAKK
jgi:hypothetical protein